MWGRLGCQIGTCELGLENWLEEESEKLLVKLIFLLSLRKTSTLWSVKEEFYFIEV